MWWELLQKNRLNQILSKFISRMLMESKREKNVICQRIFSPYKITTIFGKNPWSNTYLYYKRINYFLYRILWQIRFFCPTRNCMGILEMDFERIFDVIFFVVVLTPCTLWYLQRVLVWRNCWWWNENFTSEFNFIKFRPSSIHIPTKNARFLWITK